MRVVKPIYKIQPLQIDTVELIPSSSIEGNISSVVNSTGTSMSARVTLTANALPKVDGSFRIKVKTAGGKYDIIDTITGTVLRADIDSSDTVTIADLIPGVTIKVAAFTGETVGNACDFQTIADQTYIIPGTILGKVKTGVNSGKWRPVRSTDTDLSVFDSFRICNGFQETDKTKTVLPHGYEVNLSSVFTVDVVVYGQVFRSVCNSINLTTALEAKMPFIAFV